MIVLIHLLEHLGIPSAAAIALVIAGKKALSGGISRTGGRRDSGRRRSGGSR